MREAARFFLDYLFEDPRGKEKWLISGPSNSPEIGGLVLGPTMDHQIIRAVFELTDLGDAVDVDGDGRDEIFLGSAVLDDHGVGLWSTGLGHGTMAPIRQLSPLGTLRHVRLRFTG